MNKLIQMMRNLIRKENLNMTEGQIRYQNVMENQRHNLEMERLGRVEAGIKQQQVDVSKRQADIAQQQADIAQKAEKRKSWERLDSNIWSGIDVWNKSVSNAVNFIKSIGSLFA